MSSDDSGLFGAEFFFSAGDDEFKVVNGKVCVPLNEQVQCMSVGEAVHERCVAGIKGRIIGEIEHITFKFDYYMWSVFHNKVEVQIQVIKTAV